MPPEEYLIYCTIYLFVFQSTHADVALYSIVPPDRSALCTILAINLVDANLPFEHCVLQCPNPDLDKRRSVLGQHSANIVVCAGVCRDILKRQFLNTVFLLDSRHSFLQKAFVQVDDVEVNSYQGRWRHVSYH